MNEQTPLPMGYVDCPIARAAVKQSFAAAGVDISAKTVHGEFRRKLAEGVCYVNLQDAEVDFIRGQGASLIKSRRVVMDCGILQPLSQETGICNGCSHSTSPWLSWVNRFVRSGDCLMPREVTVVGGYLLGRQGLTGDSGAYPNYTAKGYHDIGVLPIDCNGKYRFLEMTPKEQEQVCIELRDRPLLLAEWQDAMLPLRTRVCSVEDAEATADCLASGYAVTFGSSMQGNPSPNPGGVASLYQLRDGWGRPAGHETSGVGYWVHNGRLGLIRFESWYGANFYPAGSFPDRRAIIQTDDGPRQLYPGQSAVWADEWFRSSPETWAYSYPGSAS